MGGDDRRYAPPRAEASGQHELRASGEDAGAGSSHPDPGGVAGPDHGAAQGSHGGQGHEGRAGAAPHRPAPAGGGPPWPPGAHSMPVGHGIDPWAGPGYAFHPSGAPPRHLPPPYGPHGGYPPYGPHGGSPPYGPDPRSSGAYAGSPAGAPTAAGDPWTAVPSVLRSWFHDDFAKGLVVGAAAAYLISNPKVREGALSSALDLWKAVQGGFAEVQERIEDAARERSPGDPEPDEPTPS